MIAKGSAVWFLILSLVMIPLMVSSDSIWVDEAQTVTYVKLDTTTVFFQTLVSDHKSESQMPLGMFAAWIGGKVFGMSEWGLRAPNMIWATGALLIFFAIGKSAGIPSLPFVLAVQPFLWFYVNEARPYALQICGGALLVYAIYQIATTRSVAWKSLGAWGVGSIIASGASMLAAIPVGVTTCVLVWSLARQRVMPSRRHWLGIVVVCASQLALGAYYATTLVRGAGGAKLWQLGPQNLIFSAVEFTGLAGLLPARHQLRELVRGAEAIFLDAATVSLAVCGLAIIGGMWLYLAYSCARNIRLIPSWIVNCAVVVFVSPIILFAGAATVGFPFWGRHLAACFPFFIAIFGWLVHLAWQRGLLARALVCTGLATLLLSSLLLRFSPAHGRDDYRSAAQLAIEAADSGATVWWAADAPAAEYYRVQLNSPDDPEPRSGIYDLHGVSFDGLAALPRPDLILLSKPDLYDPSGAIHRWIERSAPVSRRKFTAFDAWSFEPLEPKPEGTP